jgi:hypothetical protein
MIRSAFRSIAAHTAFFRSSLVVMESSSFVVRGFVVQVVASLDQRRAKIIGCKFCLVGQDALIIR